MSYFIGLLAFICVMIIASFGIGIIELFQGFIRKHNHYEENKSLNKIVH